MTYDWDSHVPGHHEIELRSGRFLDLEHPDPAMIGLDDIAIGLAFTCRFSGQCSSFYSVAQHAVMCSRYLGFIGYSIDVQLAGLHHDDAEAFLGDVVRPLKSLLMPQYGALTVGMDIAIAHTFGDLWPANALSIPAVKAADNWALMVEARRLLKSGGRHWGGQACNWDLDTEAADDGADLWVAPLPPEAAATWFVSHHQQLVTALEGQRAA